MANGGQEGERERERASAYLMVPPIFSQIFLIAILQVNSVWKCPHKNTQMLVLLIPSLPSQPHKTDGQNWALHGFSILKHSVMAFPLRDVQMIHIAGQTTQLIYDPFYLMICLLVFIFYKFYPIHRNIRVLSQAPSLTQSPKYQFIILCLISPFKI